MFMRKTSLFPISLNFTLKLADLVINIYKVKLLTEIFYGRQLPDEDKQNYLKPILREGRGNPCFESMAQEIR